MFALHRSEQRGLADHGWLRSQHSFSFADYFDPARMGWGNLRVINEDRIAPGTGFGTHGHRDMEIVSYVLSGELAHQDSMGNGASIRPGEVQRMTAGTGVRHSEFNHAPQASTHFLQIWLLPDRAGHAPGYAQRDFPVEQRRGRLRLVAAPTAPTTPNGGADAAGDGVIELHADARLWVGLFDADESATLRLDPSRKGYVFLARGELEVSGHSLRAGDALAIDGESEITLSAGRDAEVLVFDLAP